MYRFVFMLAGKANNEVQPPLLSPDGAVFGESVLQRADAAAPRLVSAGRSRVVYWPEDKGMIFFSWGNGSWQEARAPLPIPGEGGMLRWFVQDAGGGTSSAAIPPLGGGGEGKLYGRIALRNYGGNDAWEYVSDRLGYTQGIVKNRFDVCDGEDLEWAFISSDGKILEQSRRDRLPPPAPLLVAPAEGAWSRGPIRVTVMSTESSADQRSADLRSDTTAFITARLRYASGVIQMAGGIGSLDIASSLGEIAEVTVESFLEDASGNRGPKTLRNFTLDPKTIYVSPEPLMTGAAPGPIPKGGMDNPFSSLDEALDFAMAQGLNSLRLAGTLRLTKPVTVSRNLYLDGGWRKGMSGARAVLELGDGFSWNLDPGVSLALVELKMDREKGDTPLIQAGRSGTLEIAGSAITQTGPLLAMESGACVIKDSQISTKIYGDRRIAALSARESVVQINSSRIEMEGDYGLLMELRGGNLSAKDSTLLAAGKKTASLLTLEGTRANLVNLTMPVSARDYASVLEASASELFLSGGTLGVSARDTSAVLLDQSSAVFLDASFRVEGIASGRAIEIRGPFPAVTNCRFFLEGAADGRARRDEVFAGTEAAAPQAETIVGNWFLGFTHIWGGNWPLEKLQGFNRAFATPEKPNLARAVNSGGVN